MIFIVDVTAEIVTDIYIDAENEEEALSRAKVEFFACTDGHPLKILKLDARQIEEAE